MKHVFLLLILTTLLPADMAAQPVATTQADSRWRLVWSDEFDGDGLYNNKVWEPERGFVRNHEAQWYQGENAYQKDGCLVIEARRERRANPNYVKGRRDWRNREYIDYTSASLTTRQSFDFTYGRMEVRAKIPTAGGAWPAIWLLGKGLPWPSCGEIDIMEYYRINGVPHILANACWGSDNRYQAVWNTKRVPFAHFTEKDQDWAEKFHLWRMDWTPRSIKIFLDDELLNEIPLSETVNGSEGQHVNPFTRPQYILLNLAIGGDNGGQIDDEALPMRYQIDYVRVYQMNRQRREQVRTVHRDSLVLSDPCILADEASQTYYMTGTGGRLYTSYDLNQWTGPYRVARTDAASWMGENPDIWAAELHAYQGKYYYFATFTNERIKIDTVRGNIIPRRASHVLVSDRPEGPYLPMADETYLPATKPTLDGTFWVDADGKPYMVYCGEWLQNWNGTVEKIELRSDLSGSVGEGKVLFRASDSPWSREVEDGVVKPNKVTDGPYLFKTGTGRLGMLWTSWVDDVYTQGVAYSESGTLDGPWKQEAEPVTPPNFGHGMLFKTLDGRWLMSVHSHQNIRGRYHRVPCLFEVDLSGDKLVVGRQIKGDYQHVVTPRKTIDSGKLWPDNNGRHVNAHGGGVMKYGNTYYWFGEHKSATTSDALVGVTCYSSKDLVNWTDEGVALQVSDERGSDIERGCILERPKVVYNKKTKKFVMWFHLELKGRGYDAARYGVAVSDTPTGPYRFIRSGRVNPGVLPLNVDVEKMKTLKPERRYKPWSEEWVDAVRDGLFVRRDQAGGQMSRDMTVYVDDDGKAYHIYSSEENLTLQIAELTDDYTAHTGRYVRVAPAGHNEAPAIFKRNGTYWMITSGCTGWDPNEARMFSAPHIFGPWTQHPNPCVGTRKEITFGGQSTFILPVERPGNKEPLYIFMADIWRPRHPIDARYIWLPITFGDDGLPLVEWRDAWSFLDFK